MNTLTVSKFTSQNLLVTSTENYNICLGNFTFIHNNIQYRVYLGDKGSNGKWFVFKVDDYLFTSDNVWIVDNKKYEKDIKLIDKDLDFPPQKVRKLDDLYYLSKKKQKIVIEEVLQFVDNLRTLRKTKINEQKEFLKERKPIMSIKCLNKLHISYFLFYNKIERKYEFAQVLSGEHVWKCINNFIKFDFVHKAISHMHSVYDKFCDSYIDIYNKEAFDIFNNMVDQKSISYVKDMSGKIRYHKRFWLSVCED